MFLAVSHRMKGFTRHLQIRCNWQLLALVCDTSSPRYSRDDTIKLWIPAAFSKRGTNTLPETVMEIPRSPKNLQGAACFALSVLAAAHGALRLSQDRASMASSIWRLFLLLWVFGANGEGSE